MTNPLRLLGVAAIGVVLSLAAGAASARVHHRHHPAPAAASHRVCRHHHCRTVATATTTARVCRRHHCRTVAAAETTTRRICHHHHCRTLTVATGRARHRVEAPAAGQGNGACKSVRLHGQWVQQCNFQGQGQ